MALRAGTTRTTRIGRTAVATSGPGRGPGSDSRVRGRGGGRRRRESVVETRRRAEVLFGERDAAERDCGEREFEERGEESGELRVGEVVGRGGVRSVEGERGSGSGSAAGRRGRVRAAVVERLPVWVQARCGLERRGVVALSVVLVVAAVFAGQHFWAGRTQGVRAPEVVGSAVVESGVGGGGAVGAGGSGKAGVGGTAVAGKGVGAAGAAGAAGVGGLVAGGVPSAGGEIVVDVSGKVRDPGVHRLPAGSRVVDALRAAGGVRPGADVSGLNQARFLVDGEQVAVGVPGAVGGAGGVPGGGGVAGGGAGVPVSLGTATLEQLDALPGVGPVLAQHILDYRTQHGGFRSVDELRQVNGIGERRFSELRELVRP
ncbi:helix-hairpin-helix domain-containing protein [Streptomyces sp. ST1020]|uniref:helix-hairpin-helix domain-containing protein n=1 Tax=Streptomyces sp. ST1020 TaxID=1848901 RepID=UPI0034C6443D